jgi:hypothetical protein
VSKFKNALASLWHGVGRYWFQNGGGLTAVKRGQFGRRRFAFGKNHIAFGWINDAQRPPNHAAFTCLFVETFKTKVGFKRA